MVLVDLRHTIDSEVQRNLANQKGTAGNNDNLRLPPYNLLTLCVRYAGFYAETCRSSGAQSEEADS